MATEVDVCNLALAHFGQERINALDETEAASNENAAKCLVFFAQAKGQLLARQPWSFSRLRVILTREEATPAFDWDYQHTLPNDLARVLELRSGTAAVSEDTSDTYHRKLDRFEVSGGKILSNSSLVALKYVSTAPLVETWAAPLAVAALARLLASYLAESITGDPQRAEYHRTLYENEDLPAAQHADAVQDQSNENHPLLDRLAASRLVALRGAGMPGWSTTDE